MKSLRLLRRASGLIALISMTLYQTAGALGPVLISGVQVKDVGTGVSALEAVEVRNYSDTDMDVTDWCVVYASYSATSIPSGGSCIMPSSADDKVYLRSQNSLIMTTNELTTKIQSSNASFAPDVVLGSGLGNLTGQLYLRDSSRETVNNIKWYTSASIIAGQVNLRSLTGDPDNISFTRTSFGEDGSSGFTVSPLPLSINGGGLYDLVDVCRNIDGFQESVPPTYYAQASECFAQDACSNIDGIQSEVPDLLVSLGGECVADECSNIEDVQTLVPDGYTRDSAGNCWVDVCVNLDGIQQTVPSGYYADEQMCLMLEDRKIRINELLPNVSGSDEGLEYIELFNPFDQTISLHGYTLHVGKNLEKSYQFPDGATIAAGGYYVSTNAQIDFSLLNTLSKVRLTTPAGTVADEVSYENPSDDQSWSIIDGVWQYTNQRTPGSVNTRALEYDGSDEEVLSVAVLAPCGSGKYRNTLTNRCRNIESDVAVLASCDADEYRNPETNRCRKVTSLSSALKACDEGEERNPDTNRCRSVLASVSDLKPCEDGYERNPETNRCRKILSDIVAVNSESTDSAEVAKLTSSYVLGAGVATLAIGYGVYEWRNELVLVLRRLFRLSNKIE